ncbi:MAG: hypothetical protein GF331_01550, partial [Chitinivibrionales bacterium]|nr:hypothetical protein [Chitinivibrionales bacterium]
MKAKSQISPLFILVSALCVTTAPAKTITVNGGSLQTAIDGAHGGDTIVVNGGTYGAISIVGRSFSSSAPLIIKKGTGTPIIEVTRISGGRPIFIQNSSYIAFDGLTME